MTTLKIIIRYTCFIALQVLILNQFDFGIYIFPCVYLTLFFLPIKISRTMLIWICFLMGYIIDLFEDTGGIHAFCCVLSGAAQNYRIHRQLKISTNFSNVKYRNDTITCLIPIFIHYFLLFYLDSLQIKDVVYILQKVILNTVITFIFILLYLSVIKSLKKA